MKFTDFLLFVAFCIFMAFASVILASEVPLGF